MAKGSRVSTKHLPKSLGVVPDSFQERLKDIDKAKCREVDSQSYSARQFLLRLYNIFTVK